MRHICLSLAILSCLSCESEYYEPIQAPPLVFSNTPLQPVTIRIVSDPPGARIEINEDYIGDAPLDWVAKTNPNYNPGTFMIDYTIRALPTMPGHFVQEKQFKGGDYMPKTILFVMGLGDRTPTINVNPW